MGIACFAVLFAGVVSSVLASASTALLLGFILPVTLPGPVSSIPARLSGWLLARAASLIAITVLWPAPASDPLRTPLVRACAQLARRMRAEVDHARGGPLDGSARRCGRRLSRRDPGPARDAAFFATPYRPTGLTTAARFLVRLVDELVWLGAILDRMPAGVPSGPAFSAYVTSSWPPPTCSSEGASCSARPGVGRMSSSRAWNACAKPGTRWSARPCRRSPPAMRARGGAPDGPGRVRQLARTVLPGPELSFAVSAIAANIQRAVAAGSGRGGNNCSAVSRRSGSAGVRAGARGRHVDWHSVWLHNSVRGAVALGLAVLVADLTGVQHSFWVVLGTLTVLRSNALSTGQNALRGLLGNVGGFVIGGALIVAIGTNTTVLWILFPLAVLVAGLAPAVISFAAGQAAFTITLLILYNIIAPAGWKVGLLRVEDVAIGCAVSVGVGALFWPRGAASALGKALSGAYSETARYLNRAVMFGVVRCDRRLPATPAPRDESVRAAAAARRLDDAFRGFLAERGPKRLPLPDVAALITGVAVLRLSADAVVDLWQQDEGGAPAGDRSAARNEVLGAETLVSGWYEAMARALAGSGDVPPSFRPTGPPTGVSSTPCSVI